MNIKNRYEFVYFFDVINGNPNGDPDAGNMPRLDPESSRGLVTDVCLKRKMRDRLQEAGEAIFVQSDEKKTDGMPSLSTRAYDDKAGVGKDTFNTKKTTKDAASIKVCQKWFDVRAFGQVFAFGKSEDAAGVSIAIRGPLTISLLSASPQSTSPAHKSPKVSVVKAMAVKEARIPWA